MTPANFHTPHSLGHQGGFVNLTPWAPSPASLAALATQPKFNAPTWQAELARSMEYVYRALTEYQEIFSETYDAGNPAHKEHIYVRVDSLMKTLEQVFSGDPKWPQIGNIRAALMEIGIPDTLVKTLRWESNYLVFLSLFQILGLDAEALKPLLRGIANGSKHIQWDIALVVSKMEEAADLARFREHQAEKNVWEAVKVEQDNTVRELDAAKEAIIQNITTFRLEAPALVKILPETSILYATLKAKSHEDSTEDGRNFITLHDTLKSAIDDEQSDFEVLLDFKKEINKATRLNELEGKNEGVEIIMAAIVRNHTLAVKIVGELAMVQRGLEGIAF